MKTTSNSIHKSALAGIAALFVFTGAANNLWADDGDWDANHHYYRDKPAIGMNRTITVLLFSTRVTTGIGTAVGRFAYLSMWIKGSIRAITCSCECGYGAT